MSLSLFSLKLIAALSMTIDHIGVLLFPQHLWIRYIGRLAYPIFCFLIANGACYTHSRVKYLARLLAFAFLSQVPYALMSVLKSGGNAPWDALAGFVASPAHFFLLTTKTLNALFSLFFGLLSIVILEWLTARFAAQGKAWLGWLLGLLAAAGLTAVCFWLHCEYDTLGIPLTLAFYAANQKQACAGLSCRALPALLAGAAFALHALLSGGTPFVWTIAFYQAISLLPISLYRGEKGPGGKALQWGFYLFYPCHILLLCGIRLLI